MGDFLDFVRNNLSHAMPLLISAGIALAIIIERAKALFVTYPIKDADAFFERLGQLIKSGSLADAVALCDRHIDKPAARVCKEGILRAHQPEALIQHGLELAVGEASQRLTSRTSFLSTIANVATLLGLFGTIAGLIHSFQAVGSADPQQKATLLANGISTAMNATMLGLGVAIPCMIAFSFLINRTNRMVAEVDHSAVRTLDLIKQRYFALESEALSPMNTHNRSDDAMALPERDDEIKARQAA